jgi:hypothetical protein
MPANEENGKNIQYLYNRVDCDLKVSRIRWDQVLDIHMIHIVRIHNYLNGFKFSTYEFILSSLIVLPFSFYYLTHNNFLYGLVSLGLIANFLIIVLFALQSIRRNEKDIGIKKLFKKERRGPIHEEYPNLDTMTLVLCITLVIPFLLVILILAEKTKNVL